MSFKFQHKLCANCGIHGHLRCSRCKNVYYCSKVCQRITWKSHKSSCKPNDECPICFDTTDAPVTTLSCKHILHTERLNKRKQAPKDEHRSVTCPLCRTQIVDSLDLLQPARGSSNFLSSMRNEYAPRTQDYDLDDVSVFEDLPPNDISHIPSSFATPPLAAIAFEPVNINIELGRVVLRHLNKWLQCMGLIRKRLLT
jgi:hypothetical protein